MVKLPVSKGNGVALGFRDFAEVIPSRCIRHQRSWVSHVIFMITGIPYNQDALRAVLAPPKR